MIVVKTVFWLKTKLAVIIILWNVKKKKKRGGLFL